MTIGCAVATIRHSRYSRGNVSVSFVEKRDSELRLGEAFEANNIGVVITGRRVERAGDLQLCCQVELIRNASDVCYGLRDVGRRRQCLWRQHRFRRTCRQGNTESNCPPDFHANKSTSDVTVIDVPSVLAFGIAAAGEGGQVKADVLRNVCFIPAHPVADAAKQPWREEVCLGEAPGNCAPQLLPRHYFWEEYYKQVIVLA
jgi:hypothetical protein